MAAASVAEVKPWYPTGARQWAGHSPTDCSLFSTFRIMDDGKCQLPPRWRCRLVSQVSEYLCEEPLVAESGLAGLRNSSSRRISSFSV